jgi:hypothetical protein
MLLSVRLLAGVVGLLALVVIAMLANDLLNVDWAAYVALAALLLLVLFFWGLPTIGGN